MSVDPEEARGKGLALAHEGTEYTFCGKARLLEFRDDPAQYLDPSYQLSMQGAPRRGPPTRLQRGLSPSGRCYTCPTSSVNFLPWKRPEGLYADRDGKFIVLVPTEPVAPSN